MEGSPRLNEKLHFLLEEWLFNTFKPIAATKLPS